AVCDGPPPRAPLPASPRARPPARNTCGKQRRPRRCCRCGTRCRRRWYVRHRARRHRSAERQLQTIVVAGAGMAGLTTAEALREAGFDGTITLVGEEVHRPYERPQLSKEVLTGKGSGRGVWLRTEAELDALDLDLRLGVRAVALRPGERSVALSDGTAVTADG